MTEKFRLDQGAMQTMLIKLGVAGDDLAGALTSLNGAMERYEGCWGEDKTGKKFAEGYVESASGTRDTLGQVPTSMHDAAEGIKAAISQFTTLDEDNAALFDQQLAESMQQQEDGQGS
ncbi:hypothetical protein [Amycolatopsis sp. NPDC051061]|uniref:hypothetical protein n=1 Tax=Amycolatopsis sp. NPDC051061 TaxID=3155042 RepID=UPI003432E153